MHGYGLSLGWPSAGYGLDMCWHWLSISWQWPKINWLVTAQNQYTSKHSPVIQCTKVADDCNEYFGLYRFFPKFFGGIGWLFAGYWLAMSRTQYTSRHSHILLCTKVVMAATNTFECSVFIRCFGYRLAISWLLAGYVPKSMHSRHSHILLCTNVAHGCYQYFGL